MTRPRKQQISIDATPFYHCTSRCVRRAFLCGEDKASGRSYEHRRQLIESDVLRLSSIFFIDVAAFSIMSNHYHLILHINAKACELAKPIDIAKRWHRLYKGTEVSKRFIDCEPIEQHEREQLDTLIDTWRSRLLSISWFMKVLNERIARSANKEDKCTGHFWEARIKSQALLDEKAVIAAMAYVDLNPVRATMAPTPEQSDHTSIKLRIEHWKNKTGQHNNKDQSTQADNLQPKSLLPFVGNLRQPLPTGIVFSLIDYIQLLDWTGRQIRDDKRGSISDDAPDVLKRLNISPDHWMELTTNFESRFKGLAGSAHSIKTLIKQFGLKHTSNYSNSLLLFS